METFIRDDKGILYRVIFRVQGVYHAERVKDKVRVDVPCSSAHVEENVDPFPGDWAIKPV